MKSIVVFFLGLLLTNALVGQDSTGISYQAIVRTASGTVSSKTIGVQISILRDSVSGSAVYVERHSPTTDNLGYVTLEIGKGTTESGDFLGLDWLSGPYFIQSEIDPDGGTNYSITGTSELVSVPFAFAANYASNTGKARLTQSTEIRVSKSGDTLFIGQSKYVIIEGISAANHPPFPEGVVHCDPNNPTVVNGVKSVTGRIWMDRNLGASQVAMESNDTLSYGDLYQWGRFAEGHQCRNSQVATQLATTAEVNSGDVWYGKFIPSSSSPQDWLSPQDGNLWQGLDGTNNPCPAGFRLPTIAEWDDERGSWSLKNKSGALASPLKLPAPGLRNNLDGGIYYAGTDGFYASSSVDGTNVKYLNFYCCNATTANSFRSNGLSVRCIKD